MKTAAIVIDAWKLPIFKKTLDAEGYKYSEHKGPAKGCITLRVETKSFSKLASLIKEMIDAAARSKRH